MKITENEEKYNLTCHTNCPFFPSNLNINDGSEWYLDENNIKRRVKPVHYICNYDGHVIKDWVSQCPYNKILKKKEEETRDEII